MLFNGPLLVDEYIWQPYSNILSFPKVKYPPLVKGNSVINTPIVTTPPPITLFRLFFFQFPHGKLAERAGYNHLCHYVHSQ